MFNSPLAYQACLSQQQRGKTKTEREKNLLKYVCRCYRVLLSRSTRGARVFCCDPQLIDYLREKIKEVQNNE